MRKTRFLAGASIVAAGLLALTACNSGSPGAAPGADGTDGGSDSTQLWEVASDVSLDGSPTYDRMVSADKVVVGVKEDQPGLGYKDPITDERGGFDVEIAQWIAASLGFDADKIEYKTIPSANREQELVNGNIDYYVGTYSITDKRKESIDFAGPYLITGQGLLVAADDDSISSPDDLAGKIVCSVTGSTPLQRIRDEYAPGDTVEYDTYQAILAGYVAQEPETFKIAGETFSEERYGVGVPKGDTVLKEHINALFNDGGDVWTALFDKNLAPAGIEGEQPTADE